MITLKWFKTFNKADFEATGLKSRSETFSFKDVGDVDVMIVKGNEISVIFDGVMLSVGFDDQNPFVFDGHGVYLDANGDIWVGYTP